MPRGHSAPPSPPTSPVLHPSLANALSLSGIPEFEDDYSLSASATTKAKVSPPAPAAQALPTPPTSPTRRGFTPLPVPDTDSPANAAILILRRRSSQAKEAKKAARALARKEAKSGLRAALREDIRANFPAYDTMEGLFGELLEALNDVRAEKRREEQEEERGRVLGRRRKSSLGVGSSSPLFREWSKEGGVGAGGV